MKKIKQNLVSLSVCLAFALILGFSSESKAASALDIRWVQISNNGVHLVLQMQVRSQTNTSAQLANANFVVDFTNATTGLEFPDPAGPDPFTGQVGTDYVWQGLFDPTNGSSGYDNSGGMSVTTNSTSEFQINITSAGNANPTITIGTGTGGAWTPVVNIIFKIDDASSSTVITNPNVTHSNLYDLIFDQSFAKFTSTGGSVSGLTVGALPVSLLNFDALLQDNATILKWSTATESNNSYFTVERSHDGYNFQTIQTKNGNGNSNTIINYMAVDETPLAGVSYYRLRQTDFNGKTETFKIVSINNTGTGTFAINNISPTNFTDNTILNYTMPLEGDVRMLVTNMQGMVVRDEMVACHNGDNRYQFENTIGWKPGMYTVTLYHNGQTAYAKMIKN